MQRCPHGHLGQCNLCRSGEWLIHTLERHKLYCSKWQCVRSLRKYSILAPQRNNLHSDLKKNTHKGGLNRAQPPLGQELKSQPYHCFERQTHEQMTGAHDRLISAIHLELCVPRVCSASMRNIGIVLDQVNGQSNPSLKMLPYIPSNKKRELCSWL